MGELERFLGVFVSYRYCQLQELLQVLCREYVVAYLRMHIIETGTLVLQFTVLYRTNGSGICIIPVLSTTLPGAAHMFVIIETGTPVQGTVLYRTNGREL